MTIILRFFQMKKYPKLCKKSNWLLKKQITELSCHSLLIRFLQYMCTSFWSPLCVGQQLHWCLQCKVFLPLPLHTDCHGCHHCNHHSSISHPSGAPVKYDAWELHWRPRTRARCWDSLPHSGKFMLSGLLAYKKVYLCHCFQEFCKSTRSHRQDVDKLQVVYQLYTAN